MSDKLQFVVESVSLFDRGKRLSNNHDKLKFIGLGVIEPQIYADSRSQKHCQKSLPSINALA